MSAIATSPVLTFDEPKHEYRVNGVVVPSVTQILEDVGIVDFSHIPPATRAMAMERGRLVHLATQLDDEGDLQEATLDPELLPYVQAWRNARRGLEMGESFTLIEWRGHHAQFGYAGTLDRLYGSLLIDIKTNDAPDWTRIQLAAYAALVTDKPMTLTRLAVELHRDETYRVAEYPARKWQADFNVFLAALTVYREKHR